MKPILLLILVLLSGPVVFGGEVEEGNKALARRFYEEVWFKRNTAAVDELVAPTYIVHDTGERKNSMETADEQKKIAEFFWERGTMTGSIDYQIAEGDLVATRWQWHFKPDVWWMKVIGGEEHIPIINVFRFRDGKIVEVWNHRHDIDTGKANFIFLKGLALGLVPSIALLVLAFTLWRKLRKLRRAAPEPEIV
ncbi:MAG: nuclear transport factor 2 family protein [Saprospiraceae bacterium]|nr:nuclear transport factor 2 family protein [Pyrinomonadaceae bacterium]